MKRTNYAICGREVLGYRIGPYLAVRDKMQETYGPRDRRKCVEAGRWVLEHLPTGKILCRAGYRLDVLGVAAQVTDEEQALWLYSEKPQVIVDALKTSLPAFYEAIQEQRGC